MEGPSIRSLIRRFAVTLSLVSGVSLTTSAAALDVFMKIEGIPGDSTNSTHPNEIVLTAYSQNFGEVNCSQAVAMKHIDRASPELIRQAVAGRHIPKVIISMQKGGESPIDFFVATLEEVFIDSVEIAQQNDRLLEKVVMTPRVITILYLPQKTDGSYDVAVETTVPCQPSDLYRFR